MARRSGSARFVWMLAALLWAVFLIWLAIYPVPSAAEDEGIHLDTGSENRSSQDAFIVTTTQAITSTPANPWNPAFIEAQTGSLKPNAIPRKPGGDLPSSNAPNSVPLVTTERTYTHEIATNSDLYTITVDGTLDPDNSFVRIDNVGTTAVVNPKITIGGKDWSSIGAILAHIISPEMSDEEKARAIWEFARTERYHWWTPTQQSFEDTDPVKLFTAYGYGFCTDVALAMSAMLNATGIPSRFWNIGIPGQHDVSEAWYAGSWHLLEADRDGLYLQRDNQTIAGVEDLIQDPTFVARAGQAHSDLVQLYAETPLNANRPAESMYQAGHEISMTLRPQEALLLAWQGLGLVHDDTGWSAPLPPEYGNGRLISPLDLTSAQYRQWIVSENNTRSLADDGQSPDLGPKATSTLADLTYRVDSPYPIVGVTLTADLVRIDPSDVLEVYVSRYPDSIDLAGPDIGYNHYQLPGVYVSGTNTSTYADDNNWPPLHAKVGIQPASLVYHIQPRSTPGNQVEVGGRFYRYQAADGVGISISFDGSNWQTIWQGSELGYFDHLEDVTTLVGSNAFYVRYDLSAQSLHSIYSGWTAGLMEIQLHGVIPPGDRLAWSASNAGLLGSQSIDINLSSLLAGNDASAAYHYQIRFHLLSSISPLSVGLNGFTLTTAIQVAPRSLPALSLGENQVQYSDVTGATGSIKITHQWVERDGWHLPLQPVAPIFPADGSSIAMTQPVTFTWQNATSSDGAGIFQYHVELCDRSDCRWPLSSIFDSDLAGFDPIQQVPLQNSFAAWPMQFFDWFNPGQTYYWRVKAEDTRALWSDYSPIWRFTVAEVPIRGLNVVADAHVSRGLPTTLAATTTTGSHVDYTWLFDDGTAGTGKVMTHTFVTLGQHTVWLTGTNSIGSSAMSRQIEVLTPVAGLSATGNMQIPRGATATLTATISAGTGVTYTWSFGDGANGAGSTISHIYGTGGFYLAVVTATSPVNRLAASIPITVQNPLPVVLGVSPATMTTTDPTLSLDINGENFLPETQVFINGQPRAMDWLSASHIHTIPFDAGTLSSRPITIAIFNPSPGGGLSAPYVYPAATIIWMPLVLR